jgi:hypothetical protein
MSLRTAQNCQTENGNRRGDQYDDSIRPASIHQGDYHPSDNVHQDPATGNVSHPPGVAYRSRARPTSHSQSGSGRGCPPRGYSRLCRIHTTVSVSARAPSANLMTSARGHLTSQAMLRKVPRDHREVITLGDEPSRVSRSCREPLKMHIK